VHATLLCISPLHQKKHLLPRFSFKRWLIYTSAYTYIPSCYSPYWHYLARRIWPVRGSRCGYLGCLTLSPTPTPTTTTHNAVPSAKCQRHPTPRPRRPPATSDQQRLPLPATAASTCHLPANAPAASCCQGGACVLPAASCQLPAGPAPASCRLRFGWPSSEQRAMRAALLPQGPCSSRFWRPSTYSGEQPARTADRQARPS
jgi:hypothetical protein